MPTFVFAQGYDFVLGTQDLDKYIGGPPRSTDERQMDQIQSYLLQTMFLDPMTDAENNFKNQDQDEEDSAMGNVNDTSMSKMLMNRILSSQLARRDLLGLKKKYLKHPSVQSVNPNPEDDVPHAYVSAPYLMGKLTD